MVGNSYMKIGTVWKCRCRVPCHYVLMGVTIHYWNAAHQSCVHGFGHDERAVGLFVSIYTQCLNVCHVTSSQDISLGSERILRFPYFLDSFSINDSLNKWILMGVIERLRVTAGQLAVSCDHSDIECMTSNSFHLSPGNIRLSRSDACLLRPSEKYVPPWCWWG